MIRWAEDESEHLMAYALLQSINTVLDSRCRMALRLSDLLFSSKTKCYFRCRRGKRSTIAHVSSERWVGGIALTRATFSCKSIVWTPVVNHAPAFFGAGFWCRCGAFYFPAAVADCRRWVWWHGVFSARCRLI